MRHDRRDDDGTYRCCTPAETRAKMAREATQTHEGPFTHERMESERRKPFAVTCYEAPRFVKGKVNRNAYHGAMTGKDRY